VINVMVQPGEGAFRYEIRVQDRVVSAAGVNWQSSRFADLYVYTEPDFEGRGWARAVGAKCVEAVLQAGLLPLYTVSQENALSRRLAQALGFRPSGAHEFEGRGWLRR
jgi:predicted GNAT family acetyltransferase